MTALLLLLFLLLPPNTPERVCPYLQPETKPIYQSREEYDKQYFKNANEDGTFTFNSMAEYEEFKNNYNATSTLFFTEDGLKDMGVKIGEEPDLEAIEYNKKVKECQIANGEF